MRKRWAGAQSTCEEGVGGLRGPVCLKSKRTPEAGGRSPAGQAGRQFGKELQYQAGWACCDR